MPVELQRTLFIGLGGAGIKTILKTKSMFLERFGEVPPCVAFLGIDTDASAPHLRRAFHSNLVLLSVPDVASQYHMNKEKYSWLPEKNIEALSSSEGNSLRSTARVKFEVYRNIIKHYIVDAYHCMSAAVGADKTVPVQINLVLSLCGATGSGCFLSMGYMLKELFGESVQVDVHAVGLNDGEKVSGYAEANMYGAMLDAAYLMSKISAKSPFEMQTNEGIKSYDYKPFDRFYLTASFSRYHEMEGVCDSLGSSLFYRSTVFQPNSSFDYDCYKLSCKMLWGDFDEEDQKAWVFGHYMREIMIDTKKLSDEFSLKAGMQLVRSIIGEDYDYEMTDSAITWINKNNLCEHEADQLLDSLFDFADLKQSVIASNKGSYAKIESDTWISEGEQEASKAIEANFDERMSVIKKEIASKLSEIIASGDGLNGAKAFVNCLKTAFDIYAGEMREELVTLNKQQSGFTSEIADIIADWPRLFGIDGYKTLLQEAQKLLLTNKIDISRHVKASQLYAEMKEYLSFMEHQLAKSLLIFNEIIRMLSEMRARLAYKKVDNPFQIDLSDRVHVDGNHQDNTLEKFIANLNCDNVLDLSTLAAREVMEKVLAFTSSLDGADYSRVSVEEVILKMDVNQQYELLNRALYPICEESSGQIINCYMSVSTGQILNVLNNPKIKSVFESLQIEKVEMCPSSLQSSILIYVHKGISTANQFYGIERCKRAYDNISERMSFSFDKVLEQKFQADQFELNSREKPNKPYYVPSEEVVYCLGTSLIKQIENYNKENHGLRDYVSEIKHKRPVPKGKIAVARDFSIILNDDGHQTVVGNNKNYIQLYSDNRIDAVVAGFYNYVALTEGGTVLRSDNSVQESGVKAISAGEAHVLVLFDDGTVKSEDEFGTLVERVPSHDAIVKHWRNVKQVAVGYSNVMGLTEDGKVLYHREYKDPDIHFYENCSDVVQIDCFSCYYGDDYSAVLHGDGTVTSDTFPGVKEWKDIIQIAVGNGVIVGLKNNGTIEVIDELSDPKYPKYDKVREWTGVVSVECKFWSIVAITEDGEILRAAANPVSAIFQNK